MQKNHKLKRANDIIMSAATENKRLRAQILEYAEKVQSILEDYELETIQLQIELRKQIDSERIIIAILETYGIDVSIALGRRDEQIFSDYDSAIQCNVYRIPEKLKNHISYEKLYS